MGPHFPKKSIRLGQIGQMIGAVVTEEQTAEILQISLDEHHWIRKTRLSRWYFCSNETRRCERECHEREHSVEFSLYAESNAGLGVPR